MDSQSASQLIQLLVVILVFVVFAIFIAIAVLLYLKYKENKKQSNEEKNISKTGASNNANKQSIFKFMEFDNVRDNMIIQKDGSRYLMVVECQGINYDLMSGVEKAGVEEGFVQFLNTLRHQIQIYIQTRSIDLNASLESYSQKVKEVEMKLRNMEMQYEQMKESEQYTNEQLSKAFFEITKQQNLYEYGLSILQDTERMSTNKNILNKKYYMIIPYYAAEAGNEKLDKSEIEGIAFSELYTRAQSLISAISVCGVRGKILKTNELIELLYMAYNRDEAETFGLDKALKAGFDEMYSTAPDVLKKKMQELDKLIEEKALEKAREKINEAKSEMQEKLEEKEEKMEDIIAEMAKIIIEENQQYIGRAVTRKAIEKVDEEKSTKAKKGGKADGKKSTRGRKPATTV